MTGLGASAGGLEALERFLGGLPSAPTGMAFVAVLHLDPRRESLLPEILARTTSLTVAKAESGLRLQPEHLYVNTPGSVVTIRAGAFHVVSEPDGASTAQRHGIDTLFRSLAEEFGERAVGIVLSGTGSDGTLGLRAIKAAGGLALAQAPDSAKFADMPLAAAADGQVDLVLEPQDMPARLLGYARRRGGAEAGRTRVGERDHLGEICALLRSRTGHDFSGYKRNTIVRRLQQRMQLVGADSLSAYLERVRAEEGEATQLLRGLLIGVTQFFRDPAVFAVLAGKVIPLLFARTPLDEPLRVWVAACSSGEEVYSIAILLHEHMLRSGTHREITLFASDINEVALNGARLGRYPQGIAKDVSPQRLQRYFRKEKDFYVVVKELRELCVFSLHNVIADPPFSRIDLLSCRNLLIYLEKKLQDRLIGVYHYALRPGGYLLLGASENIGTQANLFKPLDKGQRIFQRKGLVGAAPSVPIAGGARAQPLAVRTGAGAPHKDASLRNTFERVLLEDFAPACVIINERREIVYYCGHTGKYLEPGAGPPSNNLLDLARAELRVALRVALVRALETRAERVEARLLLRTDGVTQPLQLCVRSLPEAGEDAQLWMVVFRELGEPTPEPKATGVAGKDGLPEAVPQLERELKQVKQQLRTAIGELETSNDELKASNEELQSVNEETQSSNEELQTSKEELQSVNEELETVNAELRRKVSELDEANSDLRNLFQSTPVATVFLDKALRVKHFTPAATEIFRLIASDVGRPLSDVASDLDAPGLARQLHDVLRTRRTVEREVASAAHKSTYFLRIVPYRAADDSTDGVVLTLIDTSELRRTQARQQQLASEVELGLGRHRFIMQAANLGTWEGDLAEQHISWSPEFERLSGLAPGTLGARFADYLEHVHPEDRARVEHGFLSDPPREKPRMIEHRVVLPDGAVRWLLGLGRVVEYSGGEHQVLCGVALDITDRKHAEEALHDVNAAYKRSNDDLKQLAYAIAHDLQEPLRTVSTYTELLVRSVGGKVDASARRHADRVLDASARMVSLFHALQEYWQVDKIEEHPEPVACDVALQLALAQLDEALQASGAAIQSEPLPRVMAHQAPVVQLFQNLIGNALKYRGEAAPRIRVSAEQDDSLATISVQDNGLGIEPQHHKRIFAIFKRLHGHRYPGTGIGLALCNKIATRYGGRIWVESKPGEGSTFHFTLPLEKPGHGT